MGHCELEMVKGDDLDVGVERVKTGNSQKVIWINKVMTFSFEWQNIILSPFWTLCFEKNEILYSKYILRGKNWKKQKKKTASFLSLREDRAYG